jgi:hypothetical protein
MSREQSAGYYHSDWFLWGRFPRGLASFRMVQLAFDCIFGWMGVTSRSSCSLSRYVLTRLQVVFVLAGHVTHVRAESVCPYYYLYCSRPRNDTLLHVKFYERRQLPQVLRWLASARTWICWQQLKLPALKITCIRGRKKLSRESTLIVVAQHGFASTCMPIHGIN